MDRAVKVEAIRQIEMLVDSDVCRGNVGAEYIKKRLSADKYDYLCLGFTNVNGVIEYQSFITAYDDENGVYIDVICSKLGYGGPILSGFQEFVRSQRLGNITLSTLINVIGVYTRAGFNFRTSCNDDPFVLETYNPALWQAYLERVKDKDNPVPNTAAAYDIPLMMRVIQILTRRGFMAPLNATACMNARIADFPEDLPDDHPLFLQFGEYIRRYECAVDGFTMMYCIDAAYPSLSNILALRLRTGLPEIVVSLKVLNYETKTVAGLYGREGRVTRSQAAAAGVGPPPAVPALKKKSERTRVNVKTGKVFTTSSGLPLSKPTVPRTPATRPVTRSVSRRGTARPAI